MKIKEMATLTKLSKETIRYYETLHLIKPERNQNGYREYSKSDLNDLWFIIHLKKINFSLEDISLLLKLKKQETSLSCKEETLNFLRHHIKSIRSDLTVLENSLTIFEQIESIVSTSDGIKDEEKIIPLLKKFEGVIS